MNHHPDNTAAAGSAAWLEYKYALGLLRDKARALNLSLKAAQADLAEVMPDAPEPDTEPDDDTQQQFVVIRIPRCPRCKSTSCTRVKTHSTPAGVHSQIRSTRRYVCECGLRFKGLMV